MDFSTRLVDLMNAGRWQDATYLCIQEIDRLRRPAFVVTSNIPLSPLPRHRCSVCGNFHGLNVACGGTPTFTNATAAGESGQRGVFASPADRRVPPVETDRS